MLSLNFDWNLVGGRIGSRRRYPLPAPSLHSSPSRLRQFSYTGKDRYSDIIEVYGSVFNALLPPFFQTRSAFNRRSHQGEDITAKWFLFSKGVAAFGPCVCVTLWPGFARDAGGGASRQERLTDGPSRQQLLKNITESSVSARGCCCKCEEEA